MAIAPYTYGGAQQTSSTPTKAGGLKPFDYSSQPTAPKKDLLDKVATQLKKGTDFLGLSGATDTISNLIAKGLVPKEQRSLIKTPTVPELVGTGLEIGSLVIPAVGAEKIAANIAKGALTKGLVQGGVAGAQFGALSGAGQGLTTSNASDADILKETLKGGSIGALGGATLGLGGAALGKGFSKLVGEAKPIRLPVISEGGETPVNITKIQPPIKGLLNAPRQAELLENSNAPKLLPALGGKYPIQGNGFTMSEKPDTAKVSLMKAKNEYTTALAKFNEKPTEAKLKTVLKAREGLNKVQEPVLPSKIVPKTPKTAPTAELPIKIVQTTTKPSIAPVEATTPSQIEGTLSKTAKASTDINKKLVAKGFDELPESELANFTPIQKAQQLEEVSKRLSDESFIQDVINGKVPNDIHPQVAFNAVKNKAVQEADGETLRALANSPIAKERSLAAQALGASGFDNGEIDAVKAISDINKAREDRITRTYKNTSALKKDNITNAKGELKRSAPTKQSVASFIQSLEC